MPYKFRLTISILLLAAFLSVHVRVSTVANAYAPPRTDTGLVRPSSALMQRRIALRLQRRIEKHARRHVSPDAALEAVRARQNMLRRTAHVRFLDQEKDAAPVGIWDVSARNHPMWIRFLVDENGPRFHIDEDAIRLSVEAGAPYDFPRPINGILRHIRQDRRILRGQPDGTTQAGYVFDAAELSARIARALAGQTDDDIHVATTYQEPQLFVIDEYGGARVLTRLSVGRSDFAGSPWGRIVNIRKALLDRVNGTVIPAGSVFSFNDALIGASGWQNALVIVNGKDLVYEPGGGICQASTTVYRSALLAGLPVMERKSHSLYVTYYKAFGVGIDATVYSGRQDLKVRNDTSNELVLFARIDGTEAIVELFGVPDGRSVRMEGPYFAQTAPEYLQIHGRAIRSNEIVWTQNVTYADGRAFDHTIVSQYNAIPRSLHKEYPVSRGMAELLDTEMTVRKFTDIVTRR